MTTEIRGRVYGIQKSRGVNGHTVAIWMNNKAVRIPTDEEWELGESVLVTVKRFADE